jgi:hypothetical protein
MDADLGLRLASKTITKAREDESTKNYFVLSCFAFVWPCASTRDSRWRMGIDAPALSRLETAKMLNPTLASLHKWAEVMGMKLVGDLSSA